MQVVEHGLVHDLGRPMRFVNMLRVFKPSSPMSVGSWLLSAYGPAAGAAAVSDVTGILPAAGTAATLGAGLLGPAIANTAERAVGSVAFGAPSRRLALRLSRSGARVWMYRFDYAAPASPFGATHCIELPFLFGADADWTAAPMLAGADPRDIATLGCQMRSAWLGFIRTGTPGTAWPQFTPNAPTVHHLGAVA